MITAVTVSNEVDWAKLNVALWPDHTLESRLRERAAGRCEFEYLYYLENQAVGFLSLAMRSDYVEGTRSSPVGYIEGIYVLPEFRRRGIAKELVEFAKRWSLERGCAELASDCESANSLSRVFHHKVGFVEANILVCFTMDLQE